MQPRVLILRAPGINRDDDAAHACRLAGGAPEAIHVNQLANGQVKLADYAMLVIPGGFSYGDHLGAGRLLAVDLAHRLAEQLAAFVADRRPVIGVCNGFQVLVKAGLLPGWPAPTEVEVTLTENRQRRFECRWVHLAAEAQSACHFTQGIERPIEVPVAHGEGRLALSAAAAERLAAQGQIALRYVNADGSAASYPADPNGSFGAIAGICNPEGNVLGLMPHPENAVRPHQHPRWTREAPRAEGDGLVIFRNALRYAAAL